MPSVTTMPFTVLIIAEQMKHICTKLNVARINQLVPLLNTICPQYGINSKDIFHEFLANLCHESAEFTGYEENLNYSTQGLLNTFGRHRISREDSIRYGRNGEHPANQKMIANIIYGGDWGKKNLGNASLEDGWSFRGSGPIQITGRANFAAFSLWMAKQFNVIKTPDQWAEALRTSDEWGIHSACWIFSISKKLNDEAERDEMKVIVQRINGGLNGYPERMKYYELSKKFIV